MKSGRMEEMKDCKRRFVCDKAGALSTPTDIIVGVDNKQGPIWS
jgi:hypothetical protein